MGTITLTWGGPDPCPTLVQLPGGPGIRPDATSSIVVPTSMLTQMLQSGWLVTNTSSLTTAP
jgi:hypothetical protein